MNYTVIGTIWEQKGELILCTKIRDGGSYESYTLLDVNGLSSYLSGGKNCVYIETIGVEYESDHQKADDFIHCFNSFIQVRIPYQQFAPTGQIVKEVEYILINLNLLP